MSASVRQHDLAKRSPADAARTNEMTQPAKPALLSMQRHAPLETCRLSPFFKARILTNLPPSCRRSLCSLRRRRRSWRTWFKKRVRLTIELLCCARVACDRLCESRVHDSVSWHRTSINDVAVVTGQTDCSPYEWWKTYGLYAQQSEIP